MINVIATKTKQERHSPADLKYLLEYNSNHQILIWGGGGNTLDKNPKDIRLGKTSQQEMFTTDEANLHVVEPPGPFQEPQMAIFQACKKFHPSDECFPQRTNQDYMDPGHQ